MAQKRTAYKWDYLKNHYDRISLTVKQGTRAIIQDTAEKKGQSLNKYINEAIRDALARDGVTLPEDPGESDAE